MNEFLSLLSQFYDGFGSFLTPVFEAFLAVLVLWALVTYLLNRR